MTKVTNNTSIVLCATTVPPPPKCGLTANSRNNEIAAGLLPSKRVLSRRRRWNVEFDLSENLTVRWTSQQYDLLLNKEDNTETLFSLWIRWKMTHKRLRTEVVKSNGANLAIGGAQRHETKGKPRIQAQIGFARHYEMPLVVCLTQHPAQLREGSNKKSKTSFWIQRKIGKHPVRIATCGPEAARGATRVTLIMFKWIQHSGPTLPRVSVSSPASQQHKYHVDTFSAVLHAGASPTGTCSAESQFGEAKIAYTHTVASLRVARVGCLFQNMLLFFQALKNLQCFGISEAFGIS